MFSGFFWRLIKLPVRWTTGRNKTRRALKRCVRKNTWNVWNGDRLSSRRLVLEKKNYFIVLFFSRIQKREQARRASWSCAATAARRSGRCATVAYCAPTCPTWGARRPLWGTAPPTQPDLLWEHHYINTPHHIYEWEGVCVSVCLAVFQGKMKWRIDVVF